MKIDMLHILRVSILSVGAIAISACTRISGTGETSFIDDGRRTDPPEEALSGRHLRGYQSVDEIAVVDEIESKIQAINLELKTLRSALEIMRPLDEPALDFAESVETEVVVAETKASASTPAIELDEADSDYEDAPKLENGKSLFRYADLGMYPTEAAADADWTRLQGELDLEELTPYYDEVGGGVRLSTGPFANAADLTEVCVDLSRVAGACEPSKSGRVLQ